MKELHLEASAVVGPERVVGAIVDGLVLIPVEGLHRIEKWLLGPTYVERVDYDGDFADFARQFTAEKEIRQFLRSVDDCFVESLKEMTASAMSPLQQLTRGER